MEYRTDDDIYRTRRVYLGPDGYTLWWHLPYVWYGVFALMYVSAAPLLWLLLGPSWAPFLAAAVAAPGTALVFRYVNPDRSALKVIGTLLRDWRRSTPPPDEEVALPRLTGSHVQITGRQPYAITAHAHGEARHAVH